MADERQIEPSDFEGTSLDQMRGWIQGGSGAEGLFDKNEGWKSEDRYLRDLKVRLEDKLKQVGVVMQSKSGEALQNQAVPVVLWTEVAADSALAQSELMTSQGDAFKKVQSSVPGKGEEQEVPDDSWIEESWDTMWTGSTDAEDAKAHNEKLRQEAVQAFNAYDQTSQSNASSSPVFTPPPESGANVAVTGSNHPNVGQVQNPSSTSSQWAGGSGTGGSGTGGIGGGTGGTGGGGGGGYTTTPVWQRPGGPGNPGPYAPRPGGPGGPGQGPGVPGGPGGMRPGAGTGAGAGRGGAGAGAGRGGMGAGGAGGRGAGGPGLGAGGRAGVGGLGSGPGGTGPGGVGGAGGRGGAGAGMGAAGRPQGKEGEEDQEHETPDYLIGDQGVFDEDMPRVAPPVFGDWEQK
ncbi:hypothetical protein MOQ72_41655 [Saccharopolyspora sp. K220]|uniref:hypothetical protein n=1 Tax=Saccharopolyspora soli TaxID=2926618 RepID=UPI001F567836|nr:hypothetical protein [Saccharopolyspora soli]MCI2423926.1 hypothetical protein [Saccharopolyspora soli]